MDGRGAPLLCALILLVHAGPVAAAITVQSNSSTDILVGNNISLSITYTTVKDPTVNWFKDGLLLVTWSKGTADIPDTYKGRLEIIGKGSLLISNSAKDDRGNYTVTVTATGEVMGSLIFLVEIYDPVASPSVSQSPAVVNEKTPAVNLTCSTTSEGVNYTWTKDGQNLPSDSSYVVLDGGHILQIILPNKTHSGNYICNVSNLVDSKTEPWTLKVSGTEATAITVQSDSSTDFLLGNNISLSISYTDVRDPTVQWFKDGLLLVTWSKGSADIMDEYIGRLEIIENGSLWISTSTKDDSRNYTVTVTALGVAMGSLILPVTIHDPVASPSVSQSPAVVEKNTPAVNLTCSTTSEGVNYTWTKDGQTLPSDSSYVVLDGGHILQIILPKRTHSGNYICNVSNLVDSKTETWTLSVSGVTIKSNSSTDFLVGKNISLVISYTTVKDPIVSWFRDGVNLVTWSKGSAEIMAQYIGRLEIFGTGSLRIVNSTKEDRGNYTVTVSELGQAQSSLMFQVTIYDPVTSISVSQSPTVVNEKTPDVSLTCSTTSEGVTYTWSRDGQPLPSDSSYVVSGPVLQIILPKKTHNGNYICNASNPADWNAFTWTLTVSDPKSYSPSMAATVGVVIGAMLGAILFTEELWR